MPRLFALLLLCLLWSPPASAASCSVSIGDLDFGPVDSLYSAAVDSAAAVQIDCDQISEATAAMSVCINLGAGTGGATAGARRMSSGTRTLDYQLYKDSGRSIPWGSADSPALGSARAVRFTASGETASASLTLYGRVLGGQTTVEAGSYASSLAGADASYTYAEGETLDCQSQAGAGSGQTAFSVAASVPANCLVEATDIEFGQHGLIDRNIDASGIVAVTCTPGTEYSVTLNGGLRGSQNPEQRILQSGPNEAIYGLYRDQSRTQPWGSSLDTQLPGTGAGTRQSVTVYGRVPPQPLKPGTYTDTVAVTITYDDVP